MNKKYAYITLLTNDKYFYCFLGFYASYKDSQAQYPLYVVITKELSNENVEYIHAMGVETILVDPIDLPAHICNSRKQQNIPVTFKSALTKLRIFSLPFDKIVYLDVDTLICHNIDHFFNYPHMSSVVDVAYLLPDKPNWETPNDKWFRYFNAGMLVIEPQDNLTERILDFTQNLPSDRIWSDQNILSAYYRNWTDCIEKHLFVYDNTLMAHIDSYMRFPWFRLQNINVMHFVSWYKPVPSLWKTKTFALPDTQPVLMSVMKAYFNIIDDFIDECKNQNILPKSFSHIKDLTNPNFDK